MIPKSHFAPVTCAWKTSKKRSILSCPTLRICISISSRIRNTTHHYHPFITIIWVTCGRHTLCVKLKIRKAPLNISFKAQSLLNFNSVYILDGWILKNQDIFTLTMAFDSVIRISWIVIAVIPDRKSNYVRSIREFWWQDSNIIAYDRRICVVLINAYLNHSLFLILLIESLLVHSSQKLSHLPLFQNSPKS